MRSPFFVTTRWSLVLAAGEKSGYEAEAALAALLETYWFPVYVSIRLAALFSDGDAASQAAIAEETGMTEGAVKVAAFRLRDRLRRLLHEEVEQTLAEPGRELVEDEIRTLFSSVRGQIV